MYAYRRVLRGSNWGSFFEAFALARAQEYGVRAVYPYSRAMNPRQAAFARHYAIYGNAAEAAIHAGYCPNGKRNTVREFAYHKLLPHPEVRAYIREVQRQAIPPA